MDSTEGKMQQFDRMFEQGGNNDGMVLSKKADPNIILNLAEQRVQSALERFAADKTVRMPTHFTSNSASSTRVEYMCPGVCCPADRADGNGHTKICTEPRQPLSEQHEQKFCDELPYQRPWGTFRGNAS